MVYITNDPVVSKAFKNGMVKRFLKDLLSNLDNPHTLKSFLKEGVDKFYDEQIEQLSKSFIVVERTNEHIAYVEVIRCIDDVHFKVGDMVIDKEHPKKEKYTIGRIYEDDRGLHVQLKLDDETGITWRDLSQIDK